MEPTTTESALFLSKPEARSWLADELLWRGFPAPTPFGDSALLCHQVPSQGLTRLLDGSGLVYASQVIRALTLFPSASVNPTARALASHFREAARAHRFNGPWPLLFAHAGDPSMDRRMDTLRDAFCETLRPAMGRVIKLAVPHNTTPSTQEFGYFAYGAGDSLACGLTGWSGGQRRMRDDPQAPSRSYLKVEEAYAVLGQSPTQGQRVCDLGAAPGGWSYSAASRGATVTAIDNGPLKGGALNHPLITHLREDAFTFRPQHPEPFDWLFCDVVENPFRILERVERWIHDRWCTRLIINFKTGHANPIDLLSALANSPASSLCPTWRLRHLYHDRDEITLTASTLP